MGRPPCCSESSDLKKGPWTPEEDEILRAYIQKHGHESWRALPKRAGLNRCGKSCRLRWINYLRPDIKRGNFSEDEENLIVNLHSTLGNKWSRIASQLPGRTDNEIKNFWNTHLRKKLLKAGIDPKTHNPVPNINFLLDTISQLTVKVPTIMSPWINSALQLTNINDQLLHNILQFVNMTPVPKPTFLESQCNMEEMVNQYAVNHSEDWMEYVNKVALQPHSECDSVGASLMGSYGDGLEVRETFTDVKSMSDDFFMATQLPNLLPMSPEEPMNIKNSSESNAFQAGFDDYYESLLKI
ncbi:hypothetical protein L2E82_06159 [Cichorium intybus]|uniref:Uncharacterized protein n=1 Tax=Cichorium intybus TaxID=13427 RepID=A0ACB9H945_CICIN|nr:hypothetical protein L2E82_06159 [Cichorium intybus]